MPELVNLFNVDNSAVDISKVLYFEWFLEYESRQ